MKQKKKTTPAKGKEHSKKFSANLQQRHPAKKYPSKSKPGNIELNESVPVDRHDAPVINPNQVTRL